MNIDLRLALMAGLDIPVPECQLFLHQPRIKEIALMGETDFNIGMQLLCIDKEHLNLPLDTELNNFELLMKVFTEPEAADKKETVKDLLSLVLPEYKIILTPRSILCNKNGENLIIDEGNFSFFQEGLKRIFCLNQKKSDDDNEGIPETYNPANDKAKQIAEKLYKGRKKLADIKSNKYPNDSALSRYYSILAIGVGYSTEELNNMTLYQITNLSSRFSMKVK